MAILSSPWQYIASTPPATKAYSFLLLALSAIHFALLFVVPHDDGRPFTPWLTVIPGTSFWFPWSFFTASFVETSVIELFFSFIFIPPSLRYFERLWGTKETIKFVVVSSAISNIIAFFVNWIEFVATGYADTFLYNQEYRGQMAIQAAVLVAYTQIIPEHQIVLFGSNLKIRVKRLPMIYVTFSTVLCLVGLQAPYILIQFGWLVSWTYLRFYKKTSMESAGSVDTYGDRSETFAFIYWFPPFLHKPIGLLSDIVYKFATRLKIVRISNASPGDIESGYSQVPGGARAEAERRRALALKALDQRLATSTANTGSTPGSSQPNVSNASTTTEETSRNQQKPPRPPPAAATNTTPTPLAPEPEAGAPTSLKESA